MAHLEPELLSAYIDHELPAADVEAVERHLATCATCRAEYEDLLALSTLVRGLPVYLPKREVDVSQAPRGGTDTLAKIVAFTRPLAIAAIVLLIAFAGLRLISQMGDDGKDDSQISFSAVQPTVSGTEPAGQASEQEAAEAPAADSAVEAPPMAAMSNRAVATAAVMETVAPAPAPAAGDSNGDSWLPEVTVAAVVVLLAGAAGWYKLVRSPRRRRTRRIRGRSDT